LPAGSEVISKDDRPGDERLAANDEHWFPVTNLHDFLIYHIRHNAGNTFRRRRGARKNEKVESTPRESRGGRQADASEKKVFRDGKRIELGPGSFDSNIEPPDGAKNTRISCPRADLQNVAMPIAAAPRGFNLNNSPRIASFVSTTWHT
jgi:hypothetical protein